ncbi:pantothenate synthetase [Methanimicrococcus blatticola]|uniref:4-phosphopantoate--beta-alanine ligase n=1 Tax=Methanimicrococcus blatticola TaxID=91560 RepID=A0A484F3U9_9EURY|nr:phosphopantothenate/pantothenate synthetase [Methanimicrococcus blatticola]TDQ68212.1 pantothenate synthetase [Methanimicrococcus blatticola]
MTEIPKNHPRYESLMAREQIIAGVEKGMTSRQGLIAQGRGEAFDYLIGEKTIDSADYAEAVAVCLLLLAESPVISVNGNAAALSPADLVMLSQLTGAKLEVNLFHRTEERIQKIIDELKENGADVVLGENAEPLLPLDHERAKVERVGIYDADVIFVPLEDGDRCKVLADMKKLVIAVDLNPLSRTAQTAHVSIIDNLKRALPNMIDMIPDFKNMEEEDLWEIVQAYDNNVVLMDAIETMKENLTAKQNEVLGINPDENDNSGKKEKKMLQEANERRFGKMQRDPEIAKKVMMRGGDLMME